MVGTNAMRCAPVSRALRTIASQRVAPPKSAASRSYSDVITTLLEISVGARLGGAEGLVVTNVRGARGGGATAASCWFKLPQAHSAQSAAGASACCSKHAGAGALTRRRPMLPAALPAAPQGVRRGLLALSAPLQAAAVREQQPARCGAHACCRPGAAQHLSSHVLMFCSVSSLFKADGLLQALHAGHGSSSSSGAGGTRLNCDPVRPL